MTTAFICSPYEDLIEERKAIIYAVRKLGLRDNCMELFGARIGTSIETSLNEVKQSDIMIVVIGHKYGSFILGKNISISEAEYLESQQRGLPCLVYLRDESSPVEPKYTEHDPAKLQALEKFKALLKEKHTVGFFKDSLELGVSVAVDLTRAVDEMSKNRSKTPEHIQIRETISPASAREMTWNLKMYHDQTITSPYYIYGHLPWAQEIEIATKSRVKISVSPQQASIKPREVWEGLTTGLTDIAWMSSSYFWERFGLMDILTLPSMFTSGRQGSLTAWHLYQKFSEIQAQTTGIKVLCVCTSEPYPILTNKKQIKSLEDLKGITVRSQGHVLEAVALLGGKPVFIPTADVYNALQQGVIDSLITSTIAVMQWGYYKVAPYCTYLPSTCAYFILAMNQNVWDRLPIDIQQGIMGVSGEQQAIRYGRDVFDRMRVDLPVITKKAGYPINEFALPPTEVNKWTQLAGIPIWRSWVTRMESKGVHSAPQILEETLRLAKQFR